MGRPRFALSVGFVLVAAVACAVGCAVGAEQEPGCHTDAECGGGWTCRAGACFHLTTGRSNPDGGEIIDADVDADGGG